MSFSLCLDNCQVFSFKPQRAGGNVVVTRKAVSPGGTLDITGCFTMAYSEARILWRDLVKEGAFRV